MAKKPDGYTALSIRQGLWLTSGGSLKLPDGAIGLLLVYGTKKAAQAKWGKDIPLEPVAFRDLGNRTTTTQPEGE